MKNSKKQGKAITRTGEGIVSRRRLIPPGGYVAVRRALAAGGREGDCARVLAMSPSAFSQAKRRDPKLQAAIEAGLADLHDVLVADLLDPKCDFPGLSVQQGIAVMKAKSIRSMFLLKTRFGYQEQAPADEGGRVTVEFKLPAALDLSQYRAVIEGAKAKDGE